MRQRTRRACARDSARICRWVAAATVWVIAASTPIADAEDGNAIALVDGNPISREAFYEALIEAHGAEILQQLVNVQLARVEARRLGIIVSRADIDAEYQATIDSIAEGAGMTPSEATEKNKLDALKVILRDRGITMPEFMLAIERNAYLKPIAKSQIKINEDTLKEEFARTYGEKVIVRHIQIPRNDRRALNEALDLLKNGADFADVARRISRNTETAARGGEMQPFTFADPDMPEALREMAFSLKQDEISTPVLTNEFCHILKLDARIPPEGVRFEDVREKVEASMRERALPREMSRIALELFKKSSIKVLDSTLRPRYQEYLSEGNQGDQDIEEP